MHISTILTPGAIATYVTGVFSALVLMGLYWVAFIRKKPSKILIEELFGTALLQTPKQLTEDVKILFRDEPIEKLYMITFRVRNIGAKTIKDILFDVTVEEPTEILSIIQASWPYGADFSSTYRGNINTNRITYLKAFREHGDEAQFALLFDSKPTDLDVRGGGKDWSIAFLSSGLKDHIDETARQVRRWCSIVGLLSVLAVSLVRSLGYRDVFMYGMIIVLILFLLTLFGDFVVKWWLLRSFR